MKQLITGILLTLATTLFAQQKQYNTTNGILAKGYDVVAYFNNTAVKGNKKFMTTYDGVKFQFLNTSNLDKFKNNPKKYIPQYGGYCSYAIGKTGKKAGINPQTFEIRDGKLYLFYNAWGTNTLASWLKEGPGQLKESAGKNWKKIITKK